MTQMLPEFAEQMLNLAGIAVETTVAVCEYHGAPTTHLNAPWENVMNTNMTLLSFPAFLGPPQLLLCRNCGYIECS